MSRQSAPDGPHGATGARIAAELRAAIVSGRIRPGARVRQEALAAAHGASRVPVREALRRLEAEGLVTLVANTGAWVTEVGLRDCNEMYSMRERLEPLLLGSHLPQLADREIDCMELMADAMESATEVDRLLELDREFHLAYVAGLSPSLLSSTVINLWDRTHHYRRTAVRAFHAEQDLAMHHDHRLIVDAARRRDVEDVESHLARHIRRSRLELARRPANLTERRRASDSIVVAQEREGVQHERAAQG